MKYTNQDFKNLDKNYQDFLGNSENFIKGYRELRDNELINETINHPIKKMTPTEIRCDLIERLEDYCKHMKKEDVITGLVNEMSPDQCLTVKDHLERDIF